MVLQLSLNPMDTEQKAFTVGDVVRVTVGFSYTVGQDITVTLRACPYQYILGVLDEIGSCCGEVNITLPKAVTLATKTEMVDFYLKPVAEGGIEDGTYGLKVEILGADVEAKLDDVLVISGNPVGIMGMIGPLLTLGVLMMMMPMLTPATEGGVG